MTQTHIPPAEECILFDGYLDPKGYGIKWFPDRKKQLRVNRVVLEEKLGRPIAEGKEACHTCDTPSCITPDHLWEGTHLQNMQDMKAKGRGWIGGNGNERKTHCPQGHPYDEENTYVTKTGARQCKECRRASVRRWYKEKQGIGRGA